MAAGRVVLSQYFPARDRNGRLVAGAKLYVLVNGTTSELAPIFANEAMTTPLANPVVANSSGQFVSIWADDTDLYTLSITGPNGESIGNPSVFEDCSLTSILSIVSEVAAEVSAPALALIAEAGDTEIAAIGTAGDAELTQIAAAGDNELVDIGAAGGVQILAVEAAGTATIGDVEDAAAALFYASTAAGLAAVAEGGFFKVIVDGRIVTYQDVAGVAVEKASQPKTADVEAIETDVASVTALLETATTTNLFDPATGVDNAGFNSSGAVFSLARYGRVFLPVVAGQSYTVSCNAADTAWILNQTAWINFYNSAVTITTGTLVDNSTAGENAVAFTDSGRTVCFTAPTGAVMVGINLYNSTDAAPDAAEYDAAWAAIMANSGLTKAQYEPFVAAGTKEFPAEVVNPEGPVTVLLSGTSLYVRQPVWNDSTRDTIRLMSINEVQGAAEPGTIDFLAQRFAPRSYATDLTLFAYNGGDAVWG
ncbi:MAG: hypothetical protein WAZ50_02810, partial [Minisyncoccia bacterium]